MTTVLTTQNLLLRPLRDDDAPALFALLGDPVAMEFWDRDPLPRLATVEALLADELAAIAAGGFAAWMVMKDGDPIGSVDLSGFADGEGWLGFVFRPAHWGHGHARAAVQAAVAHAFGVMRLQRIGARVQSRNLRAIRLLQDLGFAPAELLPGHVRRGGGAYDCQVFRRAPSQSASANGE